VPASPTQLRIAPTPHTAAAVALLRRARALVPGAGSLAGLVHEVAAGSQAEALAEALAALRVGALVFGRDDASAVGAQRADAVGVVDVALYHLTGAPADVAPALAAFRRAAGPLLEPPG
jgi:hypothetical protein